MEKIESILKDYVIVSEKTKEIFKTIKKFATYKIPFLMIGESGSGKKTFAEIAHRIRWGKKDNFLHLDGSVLSSEISYSDLFGYKKGAFSGAENDAEGKISVANSGTLYISNVEFVAKEIFSEIMRILKEGYYFRLGDNERKKFNGYLLFSTKKKKEDLKKSLPEDFFYYFKPYVVEIPSLRERRGDIKFLAHKFMRELNEEYGKKKRLSFQVINYLKSLNYGGNIRELKNMITYSYHTSGKRNRIVIEDLPEYSFEPDEIDEFSHKMPTLDELIRSYFFKVYKVAGGNRRKIAEIMGITERTVYNYLKKFGITDDKN